MPEHLGGGPGLLEVLGPLLAAIGIAIYLGLVVTGRQPGMRRRCGLWVAGSLAAAAAVSGPLAEAADTSYVAHMVAHVLLGMLAPLLLVLAAPVTLLLRTLPVSTARQLSHLPGQPPDPNPDRAGRCGRAERRGVVGALHDRALLGDAPPSRPTPARARPPVHRRLPVHRRRDQRRPDAAPSRFPPPRCRARAGSRRPRHPRQIPVRPSARRCAGAGGGNRRDDHVLRRATRSTSPSWWCWGRVGIGSPGHDSVGRSGGRDLHWRDSAPR